MPAVVIKNIPETLHRRLKEQARENRRSMAQEIILLLENGLAAPRKQKLPPIFKAKMPITDQMINEAKREGRA